MANASVALAQARTLLNDDLATVWTDTVLLKKLEIAHQELQSLLWNSGSPAVRGESALISVTAAATDLGANQPADLLAPYRLVEYTDAGITPLEMTEVFSIPVGIAQTTTLIYWAWKEEKIVFLGSTANRKIKIFYRKLITIPIDGTKAIGLLFGELYLGPRIAALAAGSVGNFEVMNALTNMANSSFARVLEANRGQQNVLGGA